MSTSPTRTFTSASMTTKITSVCDGRPSFRHFCPLSCVVLFAVSDCHSPFSVVCIAFRADACWVKANQSVCTHEMSLVCFLTKKGAH